MSWAPGLPPLHISISVEGLIGLGVESDDRSNAVLSAVRQGAMLGAEFARGVWLRVAGAMDIRGGFGSGETTYMQGIQAAVVEIEHEAIGNNRAEVIAAVRNTSPHAVYVEEGHAAFSLPQRVSWSSPRVKQGKKGPYLHIPFRSIAHASASKLESQGYTYAARRAMMPADVTRAARALAATTRRNVGPIRSSEGQFLAADRYNWGGRLQRDTRPSIQIGPGGSAVQEHRSARFVGRDSRGRALVNPAWTTGKWDNLFRTEQRTRNGGRQSTFITIRTLTPSSAGWNIPAVPGRFVARRVATALQSGVVSDELTRIMLGPVYAALGLEGPTNG